MNNVGNDFQLNLTRSQPLTLCVGYGGLREGKRLTTVSGRGGRREGTTRIMRTGEQGKKFSRKGLYKLRKIIRHKDSSFQKMCANPSRRGGKLSRFSSSFFF